MVELLAEKDLRALMDVVDAGRHDAPTEGMPWAAMDTLRQLIGCDAAVFCEFNLLDRITLTGQDAMDGARSLELNDDDPDDLYWDLYKDFLPCVYHERSADFNEAIKFSDFYTQAEYHDTTMWHQVFNADGSGDLKYCLLVSIPTQRGRTRRVLLWRYDGSDFGERERLLMRVLRPHLYEIYLDSQRRLRNVPRLSRREQEVLRLAAQGRSNAEIAGELFVAVSTVRKHMEHIFDRTGVRSRAGAAALVLPHLSTVDPR